MGGMDFDCLGFISCCELGRRGGQKERRMLAYIETCLECAMNSGDERGLKVLNVF